MDFVRIELGGYRQEVVIGSLSIPEYQLALADLQAFTSRMGTGEYRPFHACDDVAHYCGIVMEECSEASVQAMRRGDKGLEEVRTLWTGPALKLLKDIKMVRPTPYWWVPIEQRKYRAWFISTEKRAGCDFDIQISPDNFSIDRLAAEITWAHGSPVYTTLVYDGQPLSETFVSSCGSTAGICCKVREMDRRYLLAEEAKLERLGLLKNVWAGTIPDYEEDSPIIVEHIETPEQYELAFGRPCPWTV